MSDQDRARTAVAPSPAPILGLRWCPEPGLVPRDALLPSRCESCPAGQKMAVGGSTECETCLALGHLRAKPVEDLLRLNPQSNSV